MEYNSTGLGICTLGFFFQSGCLLASPWFGGNHYPLTRPHLPICKKKKKKKGWIRWFIKISASLEIGCFSRMGFIKHTWMAVPASCQTLFDDSCDTAHGWARSLRPWVQLLLVSGHVSTGKVVTPRTVPIISLPLVPYPPLPFPTTCNFKQWWWIMKKFLKQIPPSVCWRCSQCCQQAAVWSLAAFIEKQARMQWQMNVVGREAVDFWQWGLWKPFVSWAEEIRSKKALSVLNLRWLVPKGILKSPYSSRSMFLRPGRGNQICFRERSFHDYIQQRTGQLFLVDSLVLNNSHCLGRCLPFCSWGKVTEQSSLSDEHREWD